MEKIPTYELRINPDENVFVSAIALVEEPAIEKDFMFFNKQGELHFAMDDEKQELLGPAMVPNQKIYRRDKDGKEYNVFFSKETIREIAQVFFQKGLQGQTNLDHTTTPANSYVYQSYIVDSSKGINSPKGMNLPDGSWVVGMKVTNKEVWNDIKSRKRKGFSVEGMFNFFNKQHDADAQILSMLQQLNNLVNKNQ